MSNVVDLNRYKRIKEEEENLAKGRKPLYVSHLEGKVTGSAKPPQPNDFGDRLTRIRTSMEKINTLMAELKKMNKDK